jgi:hypothetical protein
VSADYSGRFAEFFGGQESAVLYYAGVALFCWQWALYVESMTPLRLRRRKLKLILKLDSSTPASPPDERSRADPET